ncbi:uncharacterized protein LOC143849377 [Tasmannia lanceolata]|uniref:uncharacterized protein LOC143849377 n=1 Tax=Tasmannia lanceolata TaxID=3420 RepID=UPI00406324FB
MHAVWLSMKKVMNCRARTPEVYLPEKVKGRKSGIGKVMSARDWLLEREDQSDEEVIFSQKINGGERLCELDAGDISRNIVEMIFHAALMRPGECIKKIEKVLKVKNPPETLERFEEYREMVKRRAQILDKQHPRSVVDGNELLRFYVTTMSCSWKTAKVSELCQDLRCGVCRIIRSGSEAEDEKRDGILLRASSDMLDCEEVVKEEGNVKRAVVVCRVIAGKVVDKVEGRCEEGVGEVGSSGEFYAEFEHLFVRNPNAVLPFYVIVCS